MPGSPCSLRKECECVYLFSPRTPRPRVHGVEHQRRVLFVCVSKKHSLCLLAGGHEVEARVRNPGVGSAVRAEDRLSSSSSGVPVSRVLVSLWTHSGTGNSGQRTFGYLMRPRGKEENEKNKRRDEYFGVFILKLMTQETLEAVKDSLLQSFRTFESMREMRDIEEKRESREEPVMQEEMQEVREGEIIINRFSCRSTARSAASDDPDKNNNRPNDFCPVPQNRSQDLRSESPKAKIMPWKLTKRNTDSMKSSGADDRNACCITRE